MAQPHQRHVFIDLTSTDDEESDTPAAASRTPPAPNHQQYHPPAYLAMDQPAAGADLNFQNFGDFGDDAAPGAYPEVGLGDLPNEAPNPEDGEWIYIDGEPVFIPNSPRRGNSVAPPANRDVPDLTAQAAPAAQVDEPEVFTYDTCLQKVLNIFPDVSHDHVYTLYSQDSFEAMSGSARLESIIDALVSAESYPKHDKGKRAQKRKREDEEKDDAKRWEGANRDVLAPGARTTIAAILKADFPEVPNNVILGLLAEHKHLFQTYVALAVERDTSGKDWRGRPSAKNLASADVIAAGSGNAALGEELRSARTRVSSIRAQRVTDEAQKRVEAENLQRAIAAGETAECQCCFEDLPMNRQLHCNGDTAHFTCFDCATTYIKTEVGDSRCRVLCTAGCGSGFAHAQLHLLADKKLLEKLEQLQQEKDIRDAGLDDLEECPFCDYKAIMPPVEENFEFRCENPECEKVSCRRCKALSHVPRSCEEHAKDNNLNTRHKIEEAMTAALIRSCNKCKKQFIKDYGCNKMTCSSCGNLQCYVCSESLKDYNHFDQGAVPMGRVAGTGARVGKCPLYDNVEERHEREVKEAEAAARAKAMEDNPNVSEQDLEIKVSDAVKKASQDRVQRAGAMPGGHPGYGGLLADARLGRYLGELDADEDEDEDDDPDDGLGWALGHRHGPMRRQDALGALAGHPLNNRRHIEAREARIRLLRDQFRFEARNPDGAAAAPAAPAVPGAAVQAPQNPFLGPMAGVIPVFGYQALPNYPQPQPPAPPPPAHRLGPELGAAAGRVLGHRQNGPNFFDAFFEDPFGGGDANPFALHRVMNEPPVPAARHPEDPRLQAMMARGNAAGQPNARQNEIRQTAQLRLMMQREQQDLIGARAQQAQALQNMHRNAGGQGEVRAIPPWDPTRRQRGGGFPGGAASG